MAKLFEYKFGRGRQGYAGADGEASRCVRTFTAGAIGKRRTKKTRGVAVSGWPFYQARLGPLIVVLDA
jgi:hypothetical protein